MENNYSTFRRAAIGGFNREDVISYIEKMKNEFYDYKKEVEKTIGELNDKIKELEASVGEADAIDTKAVFSPDTFRYDEETDAVSGINEATFKLRAVADELCKSLCAFMERVSENAVSVVISTDEAEEEIAEEVIEEAQVPEAEEQVEEISSQEDKVSSILKATSSFCFSSDMKKPESEIEEKKIESKRNILDILNTAGFLS